MLKKMARVDDNINLDDWPLDASEKEPLETSKKEGSSGVSKKNLHSQSTKDMKQFGYGKEKPYYAKSKNNRRSPKRDPRLQTHSNSPNQTNYLNGKKRPQTGTIANRLACPQSFEERHKFYSSTTSGVMKNGVWLNSTKGTDQLARKVFKPDVALEVETMKQKSRNKHHEWKE